VIYTPKCVKMIALQIPKSDQLSIRWKKVISEKSRGCGLVCPPLCYGGLNDRTIAIRPLRHCYRVHRIDIDVHIYLTHCSLYGTLFVTRIIKHDAHARNNFILLNNQTTIYTKLPFKLRVIFNFTSA